MVSHTGSLHVLVLCSLVLASLALGATAESHRRLLIRDIPDDKGGQAEQCRNTVQGLLYITDSLGFVCPRENLDYKSGCCKTGLKHSCEKCTLADKCCSEYEYCVSCCLAPEHNAEQLAKTTPRSSRLPGMWDDAFEYCRGVCRTHGRSTVHENAYISTRHHCFSKLGKPMLSDPLPAGALDGVELVMSEPGDTCDSACSRRNKACSSKHMPLLNTCDRLREHVGCEAGCDAGRNGLTAAPGYIDGGAPKASRPAMCFTAPRNEGSQCGAREQHMRRLCACT